MASIRELAKIAADALDALYQSSEGSEDERFAALKRATDEETLDWLREMFSKD